MSSRETRIAGLDGLRALSVLAVFAHHTGLPKVPGGFVGVDIFFVLSGFLITRILSAELARTGTISFSGFYMRRARRLYPALIIFLIAVAAYCAVFQPKVNLVREIFPALFYFMNWVRAFSLYDATMTGHTWTLAVEEQFYLVWPLLLIGVVRVRLIKPATAVGIAVLLIVGWRMYLESHGATSPRIYTGFDTRADGLMIGAFLALSTESVVKLVGRTWFIGAAFLIVCAFVKGAGDYAATGLGFLLVAIAAGTVIAKIVTDQSSVLVGVLSSKLLTALGIVSYGFYLWHYVVIRVLLYSGHDVFGAFFGGFESPKSVMFFACFVGTLVPTLLSWMLVESPILKSGHKKSASSGRGQNVTAA